ncbi:F-box/FBD-like domain protein, partial [Trifolium pratense]
HLTLDKDDCRGPDFKLPQTLFTSPNLVSLSLVGEISLQKLSSTTVSFPSLKNMLISIGSVEVHSMNALLSGCPIIETLDLSFCPISLDKVCIPPSLKRLIVNNKSYHGACLELNVPDLEYLNISKITFREVFSTYNLHNVVEAHLDVFPPRCIFVTHFYTQLHNLLGAISGTKQLVLSPSTTKWLLGEPCDLLFQEFHYLVCLELNLPQFNYNSLINWLHKCPMLQVLIIQNVDK